MDLPTEIWLHIMIYLSQWDLEPLMRVNRVLMNLVLDSRFRRAIAAPNSTGREGCFTNTDTYIHVHEGPPPVLHRVRELVFKDDAVHIDPRRKLEQQRATISIWRRALNMLLSIEEEEKKEDRDPTRQYFTRLLDRVDELSNVYAVTFHFNATSDREALVKLRHPYLEYKFKIFRALLNNRSQISNITSLSLQSDLKLLLPHWPIDIVFPNLTKLTVKVATNFTTANDSSLTKLFYPLVNNHRSSLVELVLTHSPYLPLQHVLNGIKHLPKLELFSLCWFFHNTIPQQKAIDRFMQLHAAQLVDLRLRLYPLSMRVVPFVPPKDRFPEDSTASAFNSCLAASFGALKHFSLVFDSPVDGHALTVFSFLQRHSEMLESLTIRPADLHCSASEDDVNFRMSVPLMQHFRWPDEDDVPPLVFPNLRCLSVYWKRMDVELMKFLVQSFPSLEYLCIHGLVALITQEDTQHIRRSKHLTKLFQKWKLPHLVLENNSQPFDNVQRSNFVDIFSGVWRICGRAPRKWAAGTVRKGDPIELMRSSSSLERLAGDYYSRGVY
ncbi:hypothetical protein CVT24_007039 [Panaeolus cyanescens]|uniref:F-box domain-containing protein n=1 Tax=Panaeolus cyanescens TaxID=181874 RepID=A0A409W9Y6_9AGAR|nr:hypothetical protein CVT24_007039 [Panaeolus cyanescens]